MQSDNTSARGVERLHNKQGILYTALSRCTDPATHLLIEYFKPEVLDAIATSDTMKAMRQEFAELKKKAVQTAKWADPLLRKFDELFNPKDHCRRSTTKLRTIPLPPEAAIKVITQPSATSTTPVNADASLRDFHESRGEKVRRVPPPLTSTSHTSKKKRKRTRGTRRPRKRRYTKPTTRRERAKRRRINSTLKLTKKTVQIVLNELCADTSMQHTLNKLQSMPYPRYYAQETPSDPKTQTMRNGTDRSTNQHMQTPQALPPTPDPRYHKHEPPTDKNKQTTGIGTSQDTDQRMRTPPTLLSTPNTSNPTGSTPHTNNNNTQTSPPPTSTTKHTGDNNVEPATEPDTELTELLRRANENIADVDFGQLERDLQLLANDNPDEESNLLRLITDALQTGEANMTQQVSAIGEDRDTAPVLQTLQQAVPHQNEHNAQNTFINHAAPDVSSFEASRPTNIVSSQGDTFQPGSTESPTVFNNLLSLDHC